MPRLTPQDIPSHFDIIVVGSGAAGLYATLCLPTHLQVALVTKNTINMGSSNYAQGGIAAAIDPSDNPVLHLEDTLKAGVGLCDEESVKFMVENAPAAIAHLVEMGVAFDRKEEKLAMTLEAAHSRPRVLHSADTTGRAIIDTLVAKVQERSNIQVISQAIALNLWLTPLKDRVQGISLLHESKIQWLKSSVVVLATGGGGQIFAQTTNPEVSTGDGVAIAWRAGAVLRDLEFFQFHPTALTKTGAPRFLISEAVRGEGAHLIDEEGKRFAFEYHSAGELAPRDVVSRAIFHHLHKTATNSTHARVYLDLGAIDPDRIRYRFPNIINVCQQWGIDVFQEPIPVAPAAHYWMGGIACDLMSQTSIRGLYAIGETASTGVHGANRLASNSLLECLVFAAQLSQIEIQPNLVAPDSDISQVNSDWNTDMEQIEAIRQMLPSLMWESAGISRQGELLNQALYQVNRWRDSLANFEIVKFLANLLPNQTIELNSTNAEQQLRKVAETLNLLDLGYLILKSAAWRTESRGGHYRNDYPQTSNHWNVHTLVQGDRFWKSPTKIKSEPSKIKSIGS
ncbi:MAG: L-aspartate oxidase [Okeania sp. SIO3I5]|uniref:L-aspartate oxidase n=1 Tax=Okeania sp. SIO3I5 TaxID=2607805 RepID=UPI0013B80E85|nr:L-aspartate oxidase [Okeania sp. SIO3I5]NEQ37375.1 L-aspartate oxidase [Okeania sp. SIO3I5]